MVSQKSYCSCRWVCTVNKTAVLTGSFYGVLFGRCFPYAGILILVPESGDGRACYSNIVSQKSYCACTCTYLIRDFSWVHSDGLCSCWGRYLVFNCSDIEISTFKAPLSLCRFEPVMVHCYLCGWLYGRVVCRESRETYAVFLIPPATLHWVVTRLLSHKSQLFPPLIMTKPLDSASPTVQYTCSESPSWDYLSNQSQSACHTYPGSLDTQALSRFPLKTSILHTTTQDKRYKQSKEFISTWR